MSLAVNYQNALAHWPLNTSPLVQCITNEITCESMANALLYVDAKPVMADDVREFPEFFQQNDAVLLNLGHLSEERQAALLTAADFAQATKTPMVVDLVGVAATKLRLEIAQELALRQPEVIKGNLSEMRKYAGLTSAGRGVDGALSDQSQAALLELAKALAQMAQETGTTYLATGVQDLVVSPETCLILKNGVQQLDRFTGTGDIVGSLVAALMGTGASPEAACVAGVSYFNCCGEKAAQAKGLANFRQETLNQLSLLMETPDWQSQVKIEELSQWMQSV